MSCNNHHEEEYTVKGYIIGFILAVILTLLSFIPVMKDLLHNWTVGGKILYLLGMAFLQILIQSFYFLHLQHGSDAKWKVGTYIFGLCAATIVVAGSWWAIQHLNYNMMGGSGRIVTPPTVSIETVAQPKSATPPSAVQYNTMPISKTATVPLSNNSADSSHSVTNEASLSLAPITPSNVNKITEIQPKVETITIVPAKNTSNVVITPKT